MTQYSADFELGVNGATISDANPGSATAWDAVSEGINNTFKYSNTQKYGLLSCQIVSSATPGIGYLEWDPTTITPGLTDLWGRVYLYRSAFPAGEIVLVIGFNGGAGAWQMRISASGILDIRDASGNVRGTASNAIALSQWVRLEWHVTNHTSAGALEFKLFNSADSSVPTETVTGTGVGSTEAQTTRIRFGTNNAADVSGTMYLDNILVNDTGYPGPVAVSGASSFMPPPRLGRVRGG